MASHDRFSGSAPHLTGLHRRHFAKGASPKRHHLLQRIPSASATGLTAPVTRITWQMMQSFKRWIADSMGSNPCQSQLVGHGLHREWHLLQVGTAGLGACVVNHHDRSSSFCCSLHKLSCNCWCYCCRTHVTAAATVFLLSCHCSCCRCYSYCQQQSDWSAIYALPLQVSPQCS